MDKLVGKFRGVVVDTKDPTRRGRLKARIPEALGDAESPWALPCLPYEPRRTDIAVPSVGTAVWIEFEAGDPARPIWVGVLWGNDDRPPS